MNMKQTSMTMRLLSCILCVVLIAAMALTTIGCGTQNGDGTATSTGTAAEGSVTETSAEAPTETAAEGVIEKGTGKTEFTFVVTLADGSVTNYLIHTDKETVGAALLELGLIEGEDSQYGLYVKSVQGVVADYDTDKTYWAFYVNGAYASTGVDQTKVEAGATYAFTVEKA